MSLRKLIRQRLVQNYPDSLNQVLAGSNYPVEFDIPALEFLSSDHSLIFAGPPLKKQAKLNKSLVKTISLISNFSISSMKKYVEWEELNVKDGGRIDNKFNYSAQITRLGNSINSLMYSLYRWLVYILLKETNLLSSKPQKAWFDSNAGMKMFDDPGSKITNSSINEKNFIIESVRQYNNLGSELFNVPFGLMVVDRNAEGDIVSGAYLENCKIISYNKTYGDSPEIYEQAQIGFKLIHPIDDTMLPKFNTNENKPYEFYKDDFLETAQSKTDEKMINLNTETDEKYYRPKTTQEILDRLKLFFSRNNT